MDSTSSGFQQNFSSSPDSFLHGNETVVLVDDDPFIRTPIKLYFEENGLDVIEAENGATFQEILDECKVALAILDIGLPDIDGNLILPRIKAKHPDVGVLMLTGVSDLDTALECIRSGADDYLAKPAQLKDIFLAATKILEKRRLVIQNRQYQEDLEKANFRIQLMHQLSLKMNSAYLNTGELDEILQSILVGITANEGLRFNRAFLAMFDENEQFLRGRVAIGSACREEASHIWKELGEKKLAFIDIVKDLKACGEDSEVNRMVRELSVPTTDTEHILIKSAMERQSIKVTDGFANGNDPGKIIDFLGTDSFVVVPLYSPSRPLGVIIADNFVTNHPISNSYLSALELFSSQASLAIEHSHLYMDMQKKIGELQTVNHELDKNKDMLVEAERYSTLGHMAAQIVHNMRNPITSIGSAARILAKKSEDHKLDSFIKVMSQETSKLEATLGDLIDFVSDTELTKEVVDLLPLVRKSLLLLQNDTVKRDVTVNLEVTEPDLTLSIDPRQIRKVFVHLLRNAIEASPQGGQIDITIAVKNSAVNVTFLNSGESIPDEFIKKALEPFFTTKIHGTGMGLAIVDHIVNAHGGHFTLQKIEAGTEVDVCLPI